MIHLTITVQDFNGRPRIFLRFYQAKVTSKKTERVARTIYTLIRPFLQQVAADFKASYRVTT